MAEFEWTQDRLEELKEYVRCGHPANRIARYIGCTSKEARRQILKLGRPIGALQKHSLSRRRTVSEKLREAIQ